MSKRNSSFSGVNNFPESLNKFCENIVKQAKKKEEIETGISKKAEEITVDFESDSGKAIVKNASYVGRNMYQVKDEFEGLGKFIDSGSVWKMVESNGKKMLVKQIDEAGSIVRKVKASLNKQSEEDVGAKELYLYAMNNSNLFNQLKSIRKNLVNKKEEGIYDSSLAIKLFMYFMEEAAKEYAKDFASQEDKWFKIFSTETRKSAAEKALKNFETEMSLGNYDEYLSKKHQQEKDVNASLKIAEEKPEEQVFNTEEEATAYLNDKRRNNMIPQDKSYESYQADGKFKLKQKVAELESKLYKKYIDKYGEEAYQLLDIKAETIEDLVNNKNEELQEFLHSELGSKNIVRTSDGNEFVGADIQDYLRHNKLAKKK